MTRQEIGEMLDRERQEGGSHYRSYAIQPVEYIVANGIGFLAGNVIKYVTRYRDKGGKEDILKAKHYLDLILEFEYPAAAAAPPAEPLALAEDSSGPALILKLESDDPDTVGEPNGSVRAHQERGNAPGSGQIAWSAHNPIGHQKGSG